RPPRELVATIPPALEGVVLHALEKKPEGRAGDAGEFRRELFAVAERLGLEHSAGFSAPTIETLRDAGTETPSGRLVIDIERLRRNRAAHQTFGTGAVTDEEVAPETSGLHAPPTGGRGSRAASSELGALEDASSSSVLDEGVASPGSLSGATPSSAAAPSPVVPLSQTQVEAARVEVGRDNYDAPSGSSAAPSSSRVRADVPGGRGLGRFLTQPPVLVVVICVGLLLVLGAVMLWRSPARRATAAAEQPDEADEALGRTLASVDSAPRGTLVAQPRTAAEFYENGTYNFSVRNYDAAVRDFRQAVTLQPDFPSAHNRLGRSLMLKGQPSAAAEEFRKAVEQNGGSYPVAQFNLGVALQQTGDGKAAAAAYLDAIKAKGGNYPDAFYQLGVAYSDEGRWPEAADALRKSIEQDGGRDPDAQLRLGYVLVKQEDYAGAEAVFREALERRGGNLPYAHYNLGLLYEKTGRLQDAVAEFDTFLQQAPRDENRYRVENTLRDLRRRAERESKRRQQQNGRQEGGARQQ
ncbi:MAG TPA: tetratricopeptide repeat protein, partial [Pyrinomonadaceae bacterium]|nr:tetratricopeptide repeat protein [Pyrinomonadaceae bacterium]